ncbi:MAG: VOC family protein [Kangiellaceae bacterium]|jgi:predicted enzyme related to lactoylglutathione lyase|nr:VOC family protein [Kangiellaceae bacterium]
MNRTGNIDYVEFPSKDIELTKQFFSEAFGWSFVDYGPDYIAIEGAGFNGGFYKADLTCDTSNGSVLVVLYSTQLENSVASVLNAGGKIVKPIFSFPGGRRFHFSDPNGNEYAVWSE